MKSSLFIPFVSILMCLWSHADVPKQAFLQTYSGLWLNSPFTTKPIITGDAKVSNPFEDYHLTGIAPIEGGYRITIANKKDKNAKKIVIEPGNNSGYKVVSVDRNREVSLGTTVTLNNGRFEGIVRFEPNIVVLNTPTTSKPSELSTPTSDPNQPNNGQATPNTPTRARTIPSVKPSQNPSNNNPQTRPSRNR